MMMMMKKKKMMMMKKKKNERGLSFAPGEPQARETVESREQ